MSSSTMSSSRAIQSSPFHWLHAPLSVSSQRSPILGRVRRSGAPVQRRPHGVEARRVDRSGGEIQVGRTVGAARAEEPDGLTEWVEVEAHDPPGDSALELGLDEAAVPRPQRPDPEGLEPPEKDREVRQVDAHLAAPGNPEVRHARERVERGIEQRQRGGVAHGGRAASHDRMAVHRGQAVRRQAAGIGTLMVELLRDDDVLEQLGGVHAPAAERLGDLLDRAERALAPPGADRQSDIAADRPRDRPADGWCPAGRRCTGSPTGRTCR